MAAGFVPTLDQAGRALAGLFWLILKRPNGLKLLDASPDGFWRSFGAFVWAWPVQCFLWTGVWRTVPESRPETAGETIGFFITATGFDIVAWVAPALLLLATCQMLALSGRFSELVVITNWFGLLSAYIGFVPATLRYLTPVSESASALISLGVYGLVLWLYFRVIRTALGPDLMPPAIITATMVVAGLFISELAFRTLGIV